MTLFTRDICISPTLLSKAAHFISTMARFGVLARARSSSSSFVSKKKRKTRFFKRHPTINRRRYFPPLSFFSRIIRTNFIYDFVIIVTRVFQRPSSDTVNVQIQGCEGRIISRHTIKFSPFKREPRR